MSLKSVICLLFIVHLSYQLENGLVRLPPMGWMSWTKFYCELDCERHPFGCINQDLYMSMADAMVKHGYADVGYEYIHIDDCWMERQRNSDGKLVADLKRFPSGIPALADYVSFIKNLYVNHLWCLSRFTQKISNLPFTKTMYEKIDVDTFAEWKVDYLKLDGCNIDTELMPVGYPLVSKLLAQTKRDIVYSCSWPAYLIDQPDKVNYTQIGEFCNLWRNFDDINRSWGSILSIIDYYDKNQDKLAENHGPGKWNDPDMIIVGNTEINADQSKVQMTIWSIWSAPLIMSNDLRIILPEYKEILQNKDVIAIDQDPLGIMGKLVFNMSSIGVYLKPITPFDSKNNLYSYALAFLNRGTHSVESEFDLTKVGLVNKGGYHLYDLWRNQKLGLYLPGDKLNITINPTSVEFFRCTLPQMIGRNF
uniref:Alpha-galactosidase n=1 Tax=Rhabditophanes sp. KR3021 TaxID=114890 RepID=A0AC35THE1_9BILA